MNNAALLTQINPQTDMVAYLASNEGAEARDKLAQEQTNKAEKMRARAEAEAGVPAAVDKAKEMMASLEENQKKVESLAYEVKRINTSLRKNIKAQGEAQDKVDRFQAFAVHAEESGSLTLKDEFLRQAKDAERNLFAKQSKVERSQDQLVAAQNNLAETQELCASEQVAIKLAADEIIATARERANQIFTAYKDPAIDLLYLVNEQLQARREETLSDLMFQMRHQSANQVIAQAEKLDLGEEHMAQLRQILRDRGTWIKAVTPEAREFAQLLSRREAEGARVNRRGHAVILRSDKVIVVDKDGYELQRWVIGPDGNDYRDKGQPGRRWKLGSKDIWIVDHPTAN